MLTLWGLESVPSHLRATRRTVGTGKAVPSATGVGRKTANTDDASQRRSHATRGIGKLRRIEERDAVATAFALKTTPRNFKRCTAASMWCCLSGSRRLPRSDAAGCGANGESMADQACASKSAISLLNFRQCSNLKYHRLNACLRAAAHVEYEIDQKLDSAGFIIERGLGVVDNPLGSARNRVRNMKCVGERRGRG